MSCFQGCLGSQGLCSKVCVLQTTYPNSQGFQEKHWRLLQLGWKAIILFHNQHLIKYDVEMNMIFQIFWLSQHLSNSHHRLNAQQYYFLKTASAHCFSLSLVPSASETLSCYLLCGYDRLALLWWEFML